MKLAGESGLSDDFVETCSILEHRYGRPALVEALREILSDLQPTGGLSAIPEFDWSALYSTNFDRLLELSYRQARKALVVIRSNFEYSKTETQQGTLLFKIHGDLGQDLVDGAKAGMLLTERDYDQYSEYREAVFARLGLEMLTKDVLVLGYSIRDPHLRKDMNEAAKLHATKQTPGRLLALI